MSDYYSLECNFDQNIARLQFAPNKPAQNSFAQYSFAQYKIETDSRPALGSAHYTEAGKNPVPRRRKHKMVLWSGLEIGLAPGRHQM